MDLVAITQNISEKLRYRDLSELGGRSVKINAISSVESDIQHSFESILPTSFELVDSYDPTVSIRKLGILTLDFVVSSTVLTYNYETGTELLKKLGYIDNPEVQNAYRVWATIFNSSKAVRRDLMGLGDLLEDINRGQTYFKIEF